jgi:inosine-uridine nucleoside N-ribohydrolase
MEKTRVILDTDIGPDCDDTGALAILNLLCDEGACELLAVTHCTGSPFGAPTISAINRCFGRRVPIGTCKDPDFLSTGAALVYTPSVAREFPHDFPEGAEQPRAVEVLQDALACALDHSVTMVAIGPMNNLAAALAYEVCRELIESKVCRLVAMAGNFQPDNRFAEWNVEQDIPAAQRVLRDWPSPILLCPFEAGENILTGASLEKYSDNPVSLSYRLHTNGSMLRPSWDLVTVIAAVLGEEALLPRSPFGRIGVTDKGETLFVSQPDGVHQYMQPSSNSFALTSQIESLLDRAASVMCMHSH